MPIRTAYRMTHISNIPHIMEHGFVLPDSQYASTDYKPIGDTDIIRKRHDVIKGIDLRKYVHFYFGIRTPMLYVIQNGYNGVTKQNAEDIVYCEISLVRLYRSDKYFVFSNGHILSAITQIFTKNDIPQIDSIIQEHDIYAKYWNNADDPDLKRKKEAELLIMGDTPPDIITRLIVFNQSAKERLDAFNCVNVPISINPDYYFQ